MGDAMLVISTPNLNRCRGSWHHKGESLRLQPPLQACNPLLSRWVGVRARRARVLSSSLCRACDGVVSNLTAVCGLTAVCSLPAVCNIKRTRGLSAVCSLSADSCNLSAVRNLSAVSSLTAVRSLSAVRKLHRTRSLSAVCCLSADSSLTADRNLLRSR